jgi:hypothetical protein
MLMNIHSFWQPTKHKMHNGFQNRRPRMNVSKILPKLHSFNQPLSTRHMN